MGAHSRARGVTGDFSATWDKKCTAEPAVHFHDLILVVYESFYDTLCSYDVYREKYRYNNTPDRSKGDVGSEGGDYSYQMHSVHQPEHILAEGEPIYEEGHCRAGEANKDHSENGYFIGVLSLLLR